MLFGNSLIDSSREFHHKAIRLSKQKLFIFPNALKFYLDLISNFTYQIKKKKKKKKHSYDVYTGKKFVI